ncbi:hypothetical protein EN871_29075 [bacterium M00.F.Ca.ET.228.01.1.1]|nr:hypothetical protein EN871_29075 [bacterium M00.F.Ca.ET.228.01.1.1]TGR96508.1 hypothetical protein EN834_28125 [bacterium M00.F.Ca.ET.191.01.1.1]TGT97744.1 hypothetical protein EN798_28130 [bacterium M00.F.Ca.ET.155.01.1.1]
MDIREIQALHAQYTAQPVIIDLSRHTAAMPILPAPEGLASSSHSARALMSKMRSAGRPALLALAIAAIAGAGGVSAARIWQAMHETTHVPRDAQAPVRPLPAVAQQPASADLPVNAAPPRPLTSGDLDTALTGGRTPLSHVDPKALAVPTPVVVEPAHNIQPTAVTQAAASPIRATHGTAAAAQTQPQASAPVAAQPAQRQESAAPAERVAANTATNPASQVESAQPAATRPALRPLHRIKPHREPASSVAHDAAAAPPAQPTAPATKSGDVQLF